MPSSSTEDPEPKTPLFPSEPGRDGRVLSSLSSSGAKWQAVAKLARALQEDKVSKDLPVRPPAGRFGSFV